MSNTLSKMHKPIYSRLPMLHSVECSLHYESEFWTRSDISLQDYEYLFSYYDGFRDLAEIDQYNVLDHYRQTCLRRGVLFSYFTNESGIEHAHQYKNATCSFCNRWIASFDDAIEHLKVHRDIQSNFDFVFVSDNMFHLYENDRSMDWFRNQNDLKHACLDCRQYTGWFNTPEEHYEYHLCRLREVSGNLMCPACHTWFETHEEKMTHFFEYKKSRNWIWRTEIYHVNWCDLKAFRCADEKHSRGTINDDFHEHFFKQRQVLKEYHKAMKYVKKNDSAARYLHCVKKYNNNSWLIKWCETQQMKEFEEGFYKILNEDKIKPLINHDAIVEPQGFSLFNIDAHFSLFPKEFGTAIKTFIQKLFERAVDIVKYAVELVKSFISIGPWVLILLNACIALFMKVFNYQLGTITSTLIALNISLLLNQKWCEATDDVSELMALINQQQEQLNKYELENGLPFLKKIADLVNRIPPQFQQGIFDEDAPVIVQAGSKDDANAIVRLLTICTGCDVNETLIQSFVDFARLSSISATIFNSWRSMVEFVAKYAGLIYEWMTGSAFDRSLLKFEQYKQRTLNAIAELEILADPIMKQSLYYDEHIQERAYALREEFIFLLTQTNDPGKERDYLRSTLQAHLNVTRQLCDVASRSKDMSSMRAEPFVVSISGPPGLGKSSNVNLLAMFLMAPYTKQRQGLIYSRSSGNKHYDDYHQQKVMIIDDWDQFSDDESVNIFKEFLCAKTGCIWTPPMANVNDKGMHFKSQLIILTSNQLDPYVKGKVHDEDSILRRRDYVADAVPDPYHFPNGYDYTKMDTISQVHRDKLMHIKFQRMLPLRKTGGKDLTYEERKIGDPMTWEEMQVDIRKVMARFYIGQRRVLLKNEVFIPNIAKSLVNEKILAEKNPDWIDFDAVQEAMSEPFEENLFVREDLYKDITQEEVDRLTSEKAVKLLDKIQQREEIIKQREKAQQLDYYERKRAAQQEITKDIRPSFFDSMIKQGRKIAEAMKSVWERITKWCQERPLLAILSTLAIVGTAGGTIYALIKNFFGEEEIEPQFFPSGDSVTKMKAKMNLARGPRGVIHAGLQTQGTNDPQTDAILESVTPKNLYRATIVCGQNGEVNHMFTFALVGRCFLFPKHFFSGCKEGAAIQLTNSYGTFVDYYEPKRLHQGSGSMDVCVYEFSIIVPCQKKVYHHFMDDHQVGLINSAAGVLVNFKDDKWRFNHGTIAPTKKTVCYSAANEALNVPAQFGWWFDGNTQKGDCGSVLAVYHPQIRAKLVGIHVGGVANASQGLSILVTKQYCEELLRDCATGAIGVKDAPLNIFKGEEAVPHIMPQGNYSYLGVLPGHLAPRQSDKTSLKPSILFDQVTPHTMEPAVLNPKDPRNESGESPLLKSIEKYAVPARPFPLKYVDIADYEVRELDTMPWPCAAPLSGIGDINIDFVLNGLEAQHKVNIKSSAGWPLVQQRKGISGKFGLIETHTGRYTMSPTLMEIYDARINDLFNYERTFGAWMDNLKDEKVLKEKVRIGKTRTFTIPPIDYTLASRAFTLHYMIAMYSNYNKFYSAVGMDPESFDWEIMLHRMEEVGEMGFDGDFKAYDAKLMQDLVERTFEGLSDWYEKHLPFGMIINTGMKQYHFTANHCRTVRLILCDEIIHTIQIALNCMYQTHQGNPSGNPVTVGLNTRVNAMMMRIAFYNLAEEHSIKYERNLFAKNVRETIYGDDNILTVHEDARSFFNFNTVSEYFSRFGIEYTPADKQVSKGGLMPLAKMRFLKRSTRYTSNGRLAAIDTNTIYEMLNWVRATTEEEVIEMTYVNIEGALQFAYFHGRHFFDDLKQKINQSLTERGFKPIHLRFETLDFEYRSKIF